MLMIKRITISILFLSIFFFPNAYTQEKFLSLKKDKVYVRHGPSFDSPIKYIYKKKNLPVKQIDKSDNWIRIIDLKNNSGWINDIMLKSPNSIITLEDKILFKKPSNFSKPLARLELGRLLIIKKCNNFWCKIETDNYSGWVKNSNVWGLVN
jgi:SH3-like domain-containing protein